MDKKISKKTKSYVEKYYKKYYSKLTPNWRKIVASVLDPLRIEKRIEQIEKHTGSKLVGKKVLEIGSGFGLFVASAKEKGIDCYGIEPENYSYKGSLELLKDFGISTDRIKKGTGEKLPYKDNSFDLAISFMVLEHAQNPLKLLQEATRVVKKDGLLYFMAPNYKSFWEGHYGMFWFPLLPKPLARILVKIKGRSTDMVDEVNYITPGKIKNMITHIDNLKLVTLGEKAWEERIRNSDFSSWGQTGKIVRLAKIAKTLKLTKLVSYIGKKFEMYYPIIMVAKKR